MLSARDDRVDDDDYAGYTTPLLQAQEMTSLMRRSVLKHELKDRVLWDEDLDPVAEAEDRVKLFEISGEEEEEAELLREWMDG